MCELGRQRIRIIVPLPIGGLLEVLAVFIGNFIPVFIGNFIAMYLDGALFDCGLLRVLP